jgi:hypothetical protein
MQLKHFAIIAVLFALFAALFLVFFSSGNSAKPTPKHLAGPQARSTTGYPGVTAGAPIVPTIAVQPAGLPHPFRIAPPNPNKMAEDGSLSFLDRARRLTYRDDPPNAAGEYRRTSLYSTDLKYPLVRVEERRLKQPNGQDVILAQDIASADHVIVRAQPGESAADIAAAAGQEGDAVLKPMHSPGYYLVQLGNVGLDSVPIALKAYSSKAGVVQYADADEIVHSALTPNDPTFSNEWGMNNTGRRVGRPMRTSARCRLGASSTPVPAWSWR